MCGGGGVLEVGGGEGDGIPVCVYFGGAGRYGGNVGTGVGGMEWMLGQGLAVRRNIIYSVPVFGQWAGRVSDTPCFKRGAYAISEHLCNALCRRRRRRRVCPWEIKRHRVKPAGAKQTAKTGNGGGASGERRYPVVVARAYTRKTYTAHSVTLHPV